MSEPIAFLNGQFVSMREVKVSAMDAGFVLGVTVAEQIRTFGGKLFRWDHHLSRLSHSLEIVGVQPSLSLEQISEFSVQLVSHNHALVADGDDLGLSLFITPGPYGTFADEADFGPTVGMFTYPLPFRQWQAKYRGGQRLVTSSTRQVSPRNWPTELKCRSRMHYYLADREAQAVDPSARALLLDLDGLVSEASTANVVALFEDEGLVSPPIEAILPGVSLSMMRDLAARQEIPFVHRPLGRDELAAADELLLCSTSPCILPVSYLDQSSVKACPGPVFTQLIHAWSESVGIDIVGQAERFAGR